VNAARRRSKRRPRDEEIKEDKAVKDGRVAAVDHRKERLRRMTHKVGDGHVASEDERDRPSQETDGDQSAANQLGDTLDQQEGG